MNEEQQKWAEAMRRKQVEIYQTMTPQRKLEIAMEMYKTAWGLKAAWLRQIHPEWTEEQVQDAVREIFFYARS